MFMIRMPGWFRLTGKKPFWSISAKPLRFASLSAEGSSPPVESFSGLILTISVGGLGAACRGLPGLHASLAEGWNGALLRRR